MGEVYKSLITENEVITSEDFSKLVRYVYTTREERNTPKDRCKIRLGWNRDHQSWSLIYPEYFGKDTELSIWYMDGWDDSKMYITKCGSLVEATILGQMDLEKTDIVRDVYSQLQGEIEVE